MLYEVITETFLKEFRGAIVFISHDREFIHRLATRISYNFV